MSEQNENATIYAVFSIQGEEIDPAIVTEKLGISPSYYFKKGDPFGSKNNHFRKISLWSLSSLNQVEGNDLHAHIEWILSQLEPQKESLTHIASGKGNKAIFKVVFNLFVPEWDDFIDSKLLRRIANLNSEFGISYYYLENLNERLYGN